MNKTQGNLKQITLIFIYEKYVWKYRQEQTISKYF